MERWQMISKQIKRLNRNGIYPVEVREKAGMIVVSKADLEKASSLKLFPEITIASRY